MNKRTTKKKAAKPNGIASVFGGFRTKTVSTLDGKAITLSVLDGKDYIEYLTFINENTERSVQMAKLLALSVVNEDGSRAFPNGINPHKLVKEIPGPTFVAASQAAMVINGLTIDATDEAVKD